MLSLIDRYLNGMTMYRVTLYALTILAALAFILSSFNLLSYDPLPLLGSFALLSVSCMLINSFWSWILKVPSNSESTGITIFILFFVLLPPTSLTDVSWILAAGAIAMTSKYLLTINREHLFNPAAFAAVVVGIPTGLAGWWVGTPILAIPVLMLALAVVRKTRRMTLFGTVVLMGALTTLVFAFTHDASLTENLWRYLVSWPIFFFAGFMVTEPFGAPGTRRARLLFAAGIGIFATWPLHLGVIVSTPELVLVIANIAAFLVGMRRRLVLTFIDKTRIAQDTYAFRFSTPIIPSYLPGQYLEWTLPHTGDARGIRRYFTIASAPSESELAIGVKFVEGGSSFKQHLLDLLPGAHMYASLRGGDFVLPKDRTEKLAFIAGGIGVTPFRSMVRHLIDTADHRDVALFYAAKTWPEIAYRDLWDEAKEKLGMPTTYILSHTMTDAPVDAVSGFLTADIVRERLPDWSERTFYLSGPDAMVQAYKTLLTGMGVSRTRIHTDYFPGF